jgi:3-phenylpropionate/trans-cinnamate dioxygenase ferredoxin subunit
MVTSGKKHYLCAISEVTPEKPFVFNLKKKVEIVIFQRGTDYFALENRCPHAGAHLHEGILDDNILTCIWHGWKFDIESGQCINEYWARVKTFPVILQEDKLYLHNIDEEELFL